jgi:myosin V
MDLVRQIEAKYPAFLFKQQLSAFVEGLYGMICDNLKKDLSSLLSYAIQVLYHVIFIFANLMSVDCTHTL